MRIQIKTLIKSIFYVSFFLLFFACGSDDDGVSSKKPVKIFILAGQSNMQGHGEVEVSKNGSLRWLINNDKDKKYQHLIDKDGQWKKRNDVFIRATDRLDTVKTGELSVGYGAFDYTIGPELQFGNVIGDYYDNDVLLIKTSWGGKDLAIDFCPPSVVSDSGYVKIPYAPKDTGYYYVQMLATVYDVINNISEYVPNYSGQGYEIAGFAWHQGWNDRVAIKKNKAYENNLFHLINDVRRDLGEPTLPFVIATTGMKSYKENDPNELSLIQAQMAMASYPEFKGNVKVVDTRPFWRTVEDSPKKENYHWNRNAESYLLVGESIATSMIDIIDENSKNEIVSRTRSVLGSSSDMLAPTPPMGWNSWNAFAKEIDENKIKSIADIMVSSGMRDAGYEYLVIDDAWMASERNEDGQLIADSIKFPGGMKAIGDYIHSKGLKYGIYQCRGDLTCQNLPGSFEHEQIDMNSFASWGVDYIKMDACFAARNGRLSSEDFTIYSEAIKNTGRPMVFSISDFGQGAWAWGGKNYGQLWRTSMDIFPFINSVYKCAETSGGAGSSHPGFNGLWQFSGPNHWNDPDMLQIGNLKNAVEDKVHFSLWSILAAPIMAGNDLRVMSDSTKNILLATEVIAVNQDTRGQQGYKIYNKDSVEIYNKPLADGTTAILMLNKGMEKTDVVVKWEQVGLKGKQKVRDLWKQEDIGVFEDSFVAENLGQHGHIFIKVGTVGSKPLPGPIPVSPEKYTVSRTGTTYLSDIYYIMKEFNHPVADRNFHGEELEVDGIIYEKGLGCKSSSIVMFKIDSKADRFQSIVTLDDLSPDDKTGKFRVLNEDKFGGRVLFDSGGMKKGDDPISIDIDVKGVDFIYLEFTGKGVFGNWVDAKVLVNN